MSPEQNNGGGDDEPFLQRWSRRKQTARNTTTKAEAVEPQDTDGPPPSTKPDDREVRAHPAAKSAAKTLTEADFADVDFAALSYDSEYTRFMQPGVPESIRQKALSKLWHSDTMFTQVDPFQEYAGDYTDEAMAAKGAVRTAYKIGQGFLSDEEAHVWDRLGKADVAPEVAALPILKPGYRVRTATVDDGAALLAVHLAAIRGPGVVAYGAEIAESWAHGLEPDGYRRAMTEGEQIEVAIHDESEAIIGFCGTKADRITALFVMPDFHRKGIATHLMARVETQMAQAGHEYAKIEASVPARQFYLGRGYRIVSERMGATRGGLYCTVFDMTKWLVGKDDVSIGAETPDQPDVLAFFAASEAYMGTLYPAESNHFAPASTLTEPHVLFLVARVKGKAIGCGAIVKHEASGDEPAYAEIKRMWIDPAARGLKLGAKLLAALEDGAREDGIPLLRLETGIAQPEALALYRNSGFREIEPFGDYQPDQLSLFMEKRV
jgi:putative acetyltransferase